MSDAGKAVEKRMDDAARAAWLYFIGGKTQDEIAGQLDLSRQAVQRLVALAVSEKLIRFRLDHPIAACMELASRISDRFELQYCDIVPGDPQAQGANAGVAVAVAMRLERLLTMKAPTVLCVGTGRTLRSAVEEMDAVDRPQHKIVSLVGNMAADGHASPYDVVMRLADKLGAQRYPMPVPVITGTVEDREALQGQRSFALLRELRAQARASFVGIGEIGWNAPMHRDGFMTDTDVSVLAEQGAAGEITGWSFDAAGHVLQGPINDRVASLPLECPPERLTVIAGSGPSKIVPIRAALAGRLASAIITDETTATAILST